MKTTRPAEDFELAGPHSGGSRTELVSKKAPLLALFGAAIVGAAIVGAIWGGVSLAAPASGVQAEEGPFKVRYTIQTSPSTSEGAELGNIDRIEFQPGYVVVRGRDGSGRVFFSQNTQSLSWSR